MTKWPRDTKEARNRFYGDPARGEVKRRLTTVKPPFAMYYQGRKISGIRFHEKAAPALKAALDEIWDYYGHDQTKIDASGVSDYYGAYVHRKVRGSRTKWSNHAYGAAVDLNADENPLGGGKGNMPQPVIDAFLRQGAMWGGYYRGRTDPMHFEFVDNGGRVPTSPPPRAPSSPAVVDVAPERQQAPNLPPHVAAGSGERMVVIAREGLNLRTGSSTDFQVLKTLPSGTEVSVLAKKGDWALVDLRGDGKADGFMFASFLRPPGEIPTPAPVKPPDDRPASEQLSDLLKKLSDLIDRLTRLMPSQR